MSMNQHRTILRAFGPDLGSGTFETSQPHAGIPVLHSAGHLHWPMRKNGVGRTTARAHDPAANSSARRPERLRSKCQRLDNRQPGSRSGGASVTPHGDRPTTASRRPSFPGVDRFDHVKRASERATVGGVGFCLGLGVAALSRLDDGTTGLLSMTSARGGGTSS